MIKIRELRDPIGKAIYVKIGAADFQRREAGGNCRSRRGCGRRGCGDCGDAGGVIEHVSATLAAVRRAVGALEDPNYGL